MLAYLEKFILPFSFITLYGSGFVFTQYGLQNSSPMAFLELRFFIAFLILLCISIFLRASWPKNKKEFLHIGIAGSLTVGVFSIGVFLSLAFGVSASLSALIIALQPILVAFLATKFLNEKLNSKIILGLVLGFLGVVFVVINKSEISYDEVLGLFFSFLALLGLSFGNIYQKLYCSNMNLFSGGAIQTLFSSILVLPVLVFFEDSFIIYNNDFFIALIYMSVGVSIFALSLLYIMIRKGDVSKVASIFYLVPVSATVISYFVLGENIDFYIFLGISFVVISIFLINKK